MLDIFKDFHVAVDREINKLVKYLRSDNGGEYSSNNIGDCCSKYDIRHKKTVLYSLQLNGVVKRMNRTLTERI